MARNHVPEIMRTCRTLFETDYIYVESFFDGTARTVYLRSTSDGVKRPATDQCITITQDELLQIAVAITQDAQRCQKAKNREAYYDVLDF